MDDDKIFLAEWRKYANLTQGELGKLMGITGAQISRIETGVRDFDGRYLRRFREVINTALSKEQRHFANGTIGGALRIHHYAEALYIDPDPAALLQRLTTVEKAVTELVQLVRLRSAKSGEADEPRPRP